MVQLSATRCSYIAILWVSLVSFATIILCVASQRVFIVISLSTQSGNFWIHPPTCCTEALGLVYVLSASDWAMDWSTGVRVLVETGIFSLRHPSVQTSSGAYSAFYLTGTRGGGAISPGAKRPWHEADRSSLSSAKVKNKWNYTSTPHTASWSGKGKGKLSLCFN
jgi:hypothetical protein